MNIDFIITPEALEKRAKEVFDERIAPEFSDMILSKFESDLLFQGFLLGFSKGTREVLTQIAKTLK